MAGPYTLPGFGAIPAVLGAVLLIVGFFALPWASVAGHSVHFVDLTKLAWDSEGSGGGYGKAYAAAIGYLALLAQLVNPLPWTLGSFRGPKSALVFSGIRRKEFNRANYWWYRTSFAVRSALMVILHAVGVIALFKDDLGATGAGAWLVLGGSILVTAGAAIGPRITAHMPRG
ncbi:hypothetical protein [Amycolatopsis sacchari]|uniref:Uncharacterized protein n=1 Tax=Amycolatopsis sacchari TaxID=115433 RepID=A0A1I3MPE8_9PSEU|nr:hypothetical protein [Amycolatopsis sacchari]SFI98829.1 hypothetical protein SAMN05421835_102417 [Amycolatopsis sacchari]